MSPSVEDGRETEMAEPIGRLVFADDGGAIISHPRDNINDVIESDVSNFGGSSHLPRQGA
jgi:hypothetical protein